MTTLKKIVHKVESKLGDHPNVSSDPNINPRSGIGIGANDGHNPGKSDVQNWIEAGQGGMEPEHKTRAGSTTSTDTVSAATYVVGSGKQ